MWIDSPTRIAHPEDELVALERRLRHQPTADRVKLLRLLKTGTVRSLRAAAPLLGSSERHVQRWWHTSTTQGLAARCQPASPPGAPERVSAEALTALKTAMEEGQIARLREAQAFLRDQCSVISTSLNGVSQLFKRHKIKLKTGRRRHRRGDAAAQAACKKGLRRHARPAPGHPGLCHG